MTNILLIRDTFSEQTTVGKLYINGEFFCYTLEDTVRAYGIKVPRYTAIPEGEYNVKLSESHRFKRLMPMIYTEDNEYEIKAGGIGFKGVRMHGGNTHEDTEGCVLVAHNRVDDKTIQGSAEKDLVAELKPYSEIKLTVKNS